MNETERQDGRPASIDETARHWLLRLSSEDVTAGDLAAFEAWRGSDPRHRIAFAEIRALWNDMAALEPAFADIAGDVAARSTAAATARPSRWPVPRPALAGLLAAACLLLFITVALNLPSHLAADHSTAEGETRRIVLPDGSVAFLDTDSAIAVDFGPQRRALTLLHGGAYFEVAKAAQRPFEVAALGGSATAVGTAFAMRAIDGLATVTVAEGRVRVRSPAAAAGRQEPDPASAVLLQAGERTSYRRGDLPQTVARVDASRTAAWRTRTIAIEEMPLDAALAEIDRYRPGRILLLADRERFDPITARISFDDIDGGVAALAATHGLSVTALTGFLLIVR